MKIKTKNIETIRKIAGLIEQTTSKYDADNRLEFEVIEALEKIIGIKFKRDTPEEYENEGFRIEIAISWNRVIYMSIYQNPLIKFPELLTAEAFLMKCELSEQLEKYKTGNKLTELPDSIARLKSLKILNLSGNKLTTLPDSISQLKELTTLRLGENEFTTVPESICQLKDLTTLDLADNELTELPESIEQLKKLVTYIS